MKKYIRVCNCCGNTFETDKDKQTVCLFCHHKMRTDFDFWYRYMFSRPHAASPVLALDEEYIIKRWKEERLQEHQSDYNPRPQG